MSISVTSLHRSFGGVHAVRGMTFAAEPGRITALVGPNGAGKTTLMLILASLVAPDAGEVRIAGFDPVTQSREVRRRIGWMPDKLGSWESLTCHRGLTLAARLYELPPAQAAARADAVLHLVGLVAFRNHPARVLSRGQQQKLSLARALLHEPSVLLLDEPASGLDPAARVELRDLLQHLAARGVTILVSSHVLAELDEMATRAVFVRDGMTVDAAEVEQARASRRLWRIRTLDEALLETRLSDPAFPVRVHDARRAATGEVLVGFIDEREAARALGALATSGVPITLFAPEAGDLEHTFLDLARRSAWAPNLHPGPPLQPALPMHPLHPSPGVAVSPERAS